MCRHRGFTLPELLAVLAVVGVLACLALPAVADTLARWRLSRARDTLVDALSLARAAAVYGNAETIVEPTARDGTDWSEGWVTRDTRPKGKRTPVDALDSRLAAVSTHSRTALRFGPNGTAGGTNATIVLCVRGKPATALAVIVSNAGRIRHESRSGASAARCAGHVRQKHKEA